MENLKQSITGELMDNILPFWRTNSIDHEYGGFLGRVTNTLQVEKNAAKGLILNARLLWFFAAVYRYTKNEQDYQLALRAYEYLKNNFLDREFEGYFWMLRYDGTPLQEIKKLYGQSFVLYALSEFYQARSSPGVMEDASFLFGLIERYYRDKENPGYLEVFNRDWKLADDMRLDSNDLNAAKSMNTHLHVMEAFTNYYRVNPESKVQTELELLITLFLEKIIDPKTGHLITFFNKSWQSQSGDISYGHDIEASWLLCEAAEVVHNRELAGKTADIAVKIAQNILDQAVAADGGIAYESDSKGNIKDPDTHWWAQAEAMVGFFNAYQLGGNNEFRHAAEKCWEFIEKYISDHTYGGWFYKVTPGRKVVESEYKISEWKCPYHSGRACLEMIRRLSLAG